MRLGRSLRGLMFADDVMIRSESRKQAETWKYALEIRGK